MVTHIKYIILVMKNKYQFIKKNSTSAQICGQSLDLFLNISRNIFSKVESISTYC